MLKEQQMIRRRKVFSKLDLVNLKMCSPIRKRRRTT